MKIIDTRTWQRQAHFDFFNQMDYPHFNITAPVDVTKLVVYCKEKGLSFFKCILYLAVKTANDVPEFRQRIRADQVVEHNRVHPSYTSMSKDGVFTFTDVQFDPDPRVFFANTEKVEQIVKEEANLKDEPGRDDYLFITSIPWVSFTSFSHPIHMHPVDSVPRFSWGKYYPQYDRLLLPFSVQAHHALVDGVHVGQYFEGLERDLKEFSSWFKV